MARMQHACYRQRHAYGLKHACYRHVAKVVTCMLYVYFKHARLNVHVTCMHAHSDKSVTYSSGQYYSLRTIYVVRSYNGKYFTVLTTVRHQRCTIVQWFQNGVKSYKRFRETGTIARRPGSGRPSKVTEEIKSLVHVEAQMCLDDEMPAVQLHRLLSSSGYSISLRTILRCHTALGSTFQRKRVLPVYMGS